MNKQQLFDYITFTLGVVCLLFSAGLLSSTGIAIGIFLIYFSEVVQDAYKDYKNNREIKALHKEIEDVKKGKPSSTLQKSVSSKDFFDTYREKRQKEKAWAKKHPILAVIKEAYDTAIRYGWYRLPDYPNNIKLWARTKYQRAKRGWATSDAWGFDWYLARVIKEGCQWLKENKHGIPMSAFDKNCPTDEYGGPTDEAHKIAEKKWEEILGKIIKTFETAQNIQEKHWLYQKSSEYDVKLANRFRRFQKKHRKEDPDIFDESDGHVMTKKECLAYEEGWALFQEHFFGLWD